MAKNLQNILVVAFSTFGSRLLGLLRDILMMAFLGLSAPASAFIFAFTVPNLFRRLLGEGALSSALIPIFSESLQKDGKPLAYALANRVLSRALVTLLVLTVLGMLVFGLGWLLVNQAGMAEQFSADATQWSEGSIMGILLLPYMVLVCLAALMGGLLNVLQRFAVHALTAVWLNLAIITALVIGGWAIGLTGYQLALAICLGVLAGGIVQLIVPILALRREGWAGRLDFTPHKRLDELWSIFLPALAGAAVIQVNILVSRLLAFGLNDTGVTELYLANRLVELPLGVFAIAVTTVVFPNLSLLAAKADRHALAHVYGEGVRLILAITVPAAVGLLLLAGPVLELLFAWGRFDAMDVELTTPILMVFAAALPFYGLATIATRGFHALKDTRTPVRIAVVSFVVNLLLSLALMFPLGTLGLALANVVSAAVQAIGLAWLLPRSHKSYAGARYVAGLVKIIVAALLMAGVTYAVYAFAGSLAWDAKARAVLAVGVGIPVSALVYFTTLGLLRFEDRAALVKLLLRMGRG
ncbi:MAG: murein biosynthesis integral membrane protein MurJ [Verrucomicrobiota bacterium]